MGPLRLESWLKFFNDYVTVLEIFLSKLLLPQDLFYMGSVRHRKPPQSNSLLGETGPIIMTSRMFSWSSFPAILIAATLFLVRNCYFLWERVGRWCKNIPLFMAWDQKIWESSLVPPLMGLPCFLFHTVRKLDWFVFNIPSTFIL